jgi:hypothetical protein
MMDIGVCTVLQRRDAYIGLKKVVKKSLPGRSLNNISVLNRGNYFIFALLEWKVINLCHHKSLDVESGTLYISVQSNTVD